MPDGDRLVVLAGALARRPHRGGHAWVFLQYLLGLRRLGWEVLFLDWVDDTAPAGAAEHLGDVMAGFGLDGCYSLEHRPSGTTRGVPRAEALERVGRSAGLLNVMGYLDDEELLAAAPRRVFLDIDPGFPQMWRELGLADPFAGHDAFVTIAGAIGREECSVPTCGLEWIDTRPPVVLEHWPAHEPPGRALTSVGAWRGAYGPVEYGGATYGLRVHEFRRLAPLPRRTPAAFEIALDIDEADARDRALLEEHGWRIADPRRVARDPWTYRAYIRGSLGEFMVAKSMYVKTRGGWFSDRSVCYLASGRPVLAQDTGIGALYPTGDGLLVFSTLDEAIAAVHAVLDDPLRHARAARAVAEEHFDSDRVLARLLERLGIG